MRKTNKLECVNSFQEIPFDAGVVRLKFKALPLMSNLMKGYKSASDFKQQIKVSAFRILALFEVRTGFWTGYAN